MNSKSSVSISDALEKVLSEHLNKVQSAIKDRAQEFAEKERGGESGKIDATIGIDHLNRAIQEFAPGRAITPVVLKGPGVWRRLLDSVSPVTIISMVLSVVFAAFGLWAILGLGDAEAKAISGTAYLDIAKIFAGAIVGSTSVAITSSIRRPSVNP